MAAEVDKAFRIVRKIFVPTADYTWNEGHPSGSRLNLQEAMQFEADPLRYSKLFERRLTPTKVSYSFVLLMDCSGSTNKPYTDPVIKHEQRVAVFLTELLSRLAVPHKMDAFNTGIKNLKDWKDIISDPRVQAEIVENLHASGTTNDALAIESANEALKAREEEHKYIVIISDGKSSVAQRLIRIMKKIKKDEEVTVVHFWCGKKNTKDTQGFYEHSFGNLPITSSDPEKTFFLSILQGNYGNDFNT